MKVLLVALFWGVISAHCVQARADVNPPATTGPATNATSSADGTNTVAKPDIKELLTGASFTNTAGMIMVKISESLWVGKYEVTQDEYQKVAGGNPSRFAGAAHPVDSVSWNDAKSFAEQLTTREQNAEMLPAGFVYSLPTQAQWESLAAATPLNLAVTSSGTSRKGTAPVGSLGESPSGLCDLRGNLWEFCLDPADKPYRVLRGAAWNSYYEPNLRPEFRWYANGPDDRKETYGFRCTLVPGETKPTGAAEAGSSVSPTEPVRDRPVNEE